MQTNKILCSGAFLLFLSICFTTSCQEAPLTLSFKQLKQVDSLVKKEIIPLRVELDSLCLLRFDEEVKKATDSIIEERLEEINKRLRQ